MDRSNTAHITSLTALDQPFSSLFNTPEEQRNQDCGNQYQHPADYDKFH
jgi:hypothetical protein